MYDCNTTLRSYRIGDYELIRGKIALQSITPKKRASDHNSTSFQTSSSQTSPSHTPLPPTTCPQLLPNQQPAPPSNYTFPDVHTPSKRTPPRNGSPPQVDTATDRTQLHNDSPLHTPSRPIRNLPGKKTSVPVPPPKTNVNRCKKCGIMYDTKANKAFRKRHGLSGQWIGCEVEECQFWAHAVCAGVHIARNTDITEIPFRCPLHYEYQRANPVRDEDN